MLEPHLICLEIKKIFLWLIGNESTPVPSSDWKTVGQQLRSSDKCGEALESYFEFLEQKRSDLHNENILEIHLEIVKTYHQMSEDNLAIDYAEDTILKWNLEKYPNLRSEVYLVLGNIYQKQNKHEQARQYYEQARQTFPSSYDDKSDIDAPKEPEKLPLMLSSPWLEDSFSIIFKLSIPKDGYSLQECEDKSALKTSSEHPKIIKIAIADGVSQASFSGEWAELLVNNFVEVDQPIASAETKQIWLEKSQQKWQEWLSKQQLNYFAQRKLKLDGGTYSTFLGLKIYQEEKQWKWKALAVGDCCLFIVQNNQVIKTFPLTNSSQLNGIPSQIGTSSTSNSLETQNKLDEGIITGETHFYLVTDALAGWIFENLEKFQNVWGKLNEFTENNDNNFEIWVQQLRKERKIRDDDTTLVHLKIN